MTWFDDLIEQAMPYLATEELAGTASASWEWSYTFDDADADLTSGYTATAVIKKARTDPASVVTVTCDFPQNGHLRCNVAADDTATVTPGRYLHEVEIARTSDGRRLKVVGAGDSVFVVKPGHRTPNASGDADTNLAADTDSVPYFTTGATGVTVLTDTDGAYYWSTAGTSLPVAADTDGAPYVAV